MKRYLYTCMLIAGLLLTWQANAQDQKLTLQDCIWMNPKLYPQRMVNPSWIPGEDTYSYIQGEELIKVDAQKGKETPYFNLDELNTLLHKTGKDSLRRLPSVHWINKYAFYFTSQNRLCICNPLKKTLEEVNSWPEEAENLDINETTFMVAYTKGNNLFISEDGVEKQITFDTEEGLLNGSSRVARNEFGISKGTFWSDNGHYLAFYKMDERMVTNYPLVDITQRTAEVENTRYPMAGMKSHQVMLAVYDTQTGKTVLAETEKNSEQYLTIISWDPSEKYFYIGILNREQDHLQLNPYQNHQKSKHILSQLLHHQENNDFLIPFHFRLYPLLST